jgi:ComF family protein
MTSLLEKTINIIAPHHCILCSKEGNIVCDLCQPDVFDEGCEVCFLCNQPTIDSKVCTGCKPQTALDHVWTAGTYEDERRRLIKAFKFERLRAAYVPLAGAMSDVLPYLTDVVVVPIPTAARRVRVRGYDQAKLLAKEIARLRGWRYTEVLRRRHGARQVGAGRAQRARQAEEAYELTREHLLEGRHVLLVDDVTTSGATLKAAARLVAAYAKCVDGVAAAKHTLR